MVRFITSIGNHWTDVESVAGVLSKTNGSRSSGEHEPHADDGGSRPKGRPSNSNDVIFTNCQGMRENANFSDSVCRSKTKQFPTEFMKFPQFFPTILKIPNLL